MHPTKDKKVLYKAFSPDKTHKTLLRRRFHLMSEKIMKNAKLIAICKSRSRLLDVSIQATETGQYLKGES